MSELISESLINGQERQERSDQYERYRNPKWRPVLELMDVMDKEGWNSPHAVLNSVAWSVYHIPTQNEFYPLPNEDGSLSDYQRFYLEAVNWVERLAGEIDIDYLVNFPQRFGQGKLCELDQRMCQAIDEVAKLLMQTTDGFRLEFTLTDENYARLDTSKKKLAAFLLLRARLANKVGKAINILLLGAKQAGIDYNGSAGLGEIYRKIKEQESEESYLREIDDYYLDSPMGEIRTIDWLDQLYRHPLLTNTNEAFTEGKNKVRERFLEQTPSIEEVPVPEASPLERLFNIAFEGTVGLDDECQDFIAQRRAEGRPMKLSRKAKDWAKNFYREISLSYNIEDIQAEIEKMSDRLRDQKNRKVQRLLLSSLRARARRDAEADLRQNILETRGRWWQKLGLTPFEVNYLTEMELSKRKSSGVKRLTKEVTQLRREIEASLGRRIKNYRKWARGRIGRRLRQLGLK